MAEQYIGNISGFKYTVLHEDGDDVTIRNEWNKRVRTVDRFTLRMEFARIPATIATDASDKKQQRK